MSFVVRLRKFSFPYLISAVLGIGFTAFIYHCSEKRFEKRLESMKSADDKSIERLILEWRDMV